MSMTRAVRAVAGVADRSGRRRVAVVHEWIDAQAGSEQVFEAIAGAFPEADLYALSVRPGVDLALGGREVTTTFLDRPGLRDRRGLTLPVMPFAWWQLGGGEYDLVISSHHAFAHSNRLVADAGVHLVYCHTPARYLWQPDIDGRGASPLLAPARAALKRLDRRYVSHVAGYVANSVEIRDRISACWGRDSEVIHPPVHIDYFAEPGPEREREYVLGFGRWIEYKRLPLVIAAAEAAGRPVKIAGRGPDRPRIVEAARHATVPVEIVESPSDEQLRDLYRGAMCLVFPTRDDFGIVPVEAQAAGAPVVALGVGGALDTVVDGVTGRLVPDVGIGTLAAAIDQCVGLSSDDCRANARRFAPSEFTRKVRDWTARNVAWDIRDVSPDPAPGRSA